jgi:hypothetical protein
MYSVVPLSELLPDSGFICCFYECETRSFTLKRRTWNKGVWELSEDKKYLDIRGQVIAKELHIHLI